MLKQAEGSRKTFKELCQQAFACRTDALAAVEQWQEKQAYWQSKPRCVTCPFTKAKGDRVKINSPFAPIMKSAVTYTRRWKRRDEATKKLGLFTLATNDIGGSLSMAEMLSTYKSQQAVEKGFRFLKSPDFLTSAFYVKKPERIEALLMVMTTCLMVYAALGHRIREQLKGQDEYFPDMKKKPTQNPTARWVFQCFAGIELLTINEQQTLILNMKDRQAIIIKILGINYQRIYS
jgi:transposase